MVACAGCAYEERRGGDFLQVHPALIYAQRGGGRNPFRSHFSNPPSYFSSLIGRLKSGKVEGCGRTGEKMKMYLKVFFRG